MSKKNLFQKNDLIFFYSNQKFPKDLVFPEALPHKELLFSNDTQQPENNTQNKKFNFSSCFLIEEESDSKRFKNKKFQHNNITKGNNFNNNNNWKKAELEDPGFFDNFKGRTDPSQVNIFKRNMELMEVLENSIAINNNEILDFGKNNENKNFNLKKIGDEPKKDFVSTISATADELFSADNNYDLNANTKKDKNEGK